MTLFLHFDGGFSMADSILDSITEQYHSHYQIRKKNWQIMYFLIPQKLNIFLLLP